MRRPNEEMSLKNSARRRSNMIEEQRSLALDDIDEQRPSALKLKSSTRRRLMKLGSSARRRSIKRAAPVGAQ